MTVLLADRDMVNIVEEQRRLLEQTRYRYLPYVTKGVPMGQDP